MMNATSNLTPEYQAISRSRRQLEELMAPHLKDIAHNLRDRGYLTSSQCESILKSSDGCEELVKAVLLSVTTDPVNTFVVFVDVLKAEGNKPFKKFVENSIEAERKKIYREKLSQSSGIASSRRDYDVFISSGHESEADSFVDTLLDGLKREGMKAFVAQECIQPGESWPAEIIQAINVCKVFIAVLTKKYVQSTYCNGELYEAEALKKPIFPVVLESDWQEEPAANPIKEVIRETQFVQKENLQQLVKSIKIRVGRDTSSIDNTSKRPADRGNSPTIVKKVKKAEPKDEGRAGSQSLKIPKQSHPPEGLQRFSGIANNGQQFYSEAHSSHASPAALTHQPFDFISTPSFRSHASRSGLGKGLSMSTTEEDTRTLEKLNQLSASLAPRKNETEMDNAVSLHRTGLPCYPTLDEYCKKYRLTDDALNKEVSGDHIHKISFPHNLRIPKLADCLGVSLSAYEFFQIFEKSKIRNKIHKLP